MWLLLNIGGCRPFTFSRTSQNYKFVQNFIAYPWTFNMEVIIYTKALTCRVSLQELVKLMLKSLYIILIAKVIVWIIVGSFCRQRLHWSRYMLKCLHYSQCWKSKEWSSHATSHLTGHMTSSPTLSRTGYLLRIFALCTLRSSMVKCHPNGVGLCLVVLTIFSLRSAGLDVCIKLYF